MNEIAEEVLIRTEKHLFRNNTGDADEGYILTGNMVNIMHGTP